MLAPEFGPPWIDTGEARHGWLRRQLEAHPSISYVATIMCPFVGLALAVCLLAWRQTRRGLTVLAIAVVPFVLVAVSAPPGDTGASVARPHLERNSVARANRQVRRCMTHSRTKALVRCLDLASR